MLNASHGSRRCGIPDESQMWVLPVLGVIALNGADEVCFFPAADADGIPVEDPDLVAAILAAPRRLVASERVFAVFESALTEEDRDV